MQGVLAVLHDGAARAAEVLALDLDELDPANPAGKAGPARPC